MKKICLWSIAVLVCCSCAATDTPPGQTPKDDRAFTIPASIVFDSERYDKVTGPGERPDVARYLRPGESAESFSTWSKMLIVRNLYGKTDPVQAATKRLDELRAQARIQGGISESSTDTALVDYALAMRFPNFFSFEVHHLKFLKRPSSVVVYEFIAQKGAKDDNVVNDFIAKELENTKEKFRAEMRKADWVR